MFYAAVLVGRLHGEQSCCEEVINRSSFRQQAQSARQNDYMWAGMPIADASGTHTHTNKRLLKRPSQKKKKKEKRSCGVHVHADDIWIFQNARCENVAFYETGLGN